MPEIQRLLSCLKLNAGLITDFIHKLCIFSGIYVIILLIK